MGKGKKKNADAGGATREGEDPEAFLKNYNLVCGKIGITPDCDVVALITGANDEVPQAPVQLALDSDLGSAGVRAISEAILGRLEGMAGPYKLLNTLRFWRCNARDEGAAAVAEVLKCGGADVRIEFLQFLDNKISVGGCTALGAALGAGCNTSLLTLQLDYNDNIGTEGLAALCKGLSTNSTLKASHLRCNVVRLSLSYCDILPDGGQHLQRALAYPSCAIQQLNLRGNRLRGPGLSAISTALKSNPNTKLQMLDFCDNDIGPDQEALKVFAELVKTNKSLTHIKLENNRIEEPGAVVLIDSGAFEKTCNSTLQEFLLDVKLPKDMFAKLVRAGGGGKGKKGKKGKKKKK